MNTPTSPGTNSETPATSTRRRRRTARRKGKIGRLPHAVREELNRRLWDGEAGGSLLAWLNGPEMRGARRVEGRGDEAGPPGGRAITKQNLSEWRKGGYEDWVERQEAREGTGRLAEEVKAMDEAAGGRRFSEVVANMAGLDLGLLLQATRRMEDGAEKTRTVLQTVRELVRLRALERESERAQRGAGAELLASDTPPAVQGSPGKLGRIKDGGVSEGEGGLTRPQKTESAVGAVAERAGGAAVQGSPRKLSPTEGKRHGFLGRWPRLEMNRAVGASSEPAMLCPKLTGREIADGATSSRQVTPDPQESDGGNREKLGAADPVRAGAGIEDGPEENSSGAIRFPFAPVRAAG